MTQYRRLDPKRGIADHIYQLRSMIGTNDTAPTGDVGVRGVLEAVDPVTGVSTLFGQLPDGSYGVQEYVNDTTPPGRPSTPTGEPTIAGAILYWDGMENGGLSQPKDYSRTIIQYSKDSLTWTDATTIYDKTTTTVGGLEIGVPHTFRLVSYDRNNNQSEPSGTVSITPIAMADNTEIDEAIEALKAKDVTLGQTAEQAATNAQKALDDLLIANGAITDASNLAKSKIRTFTGATAPAGLTSDNIGDLWIDANGRVSRWQLDAGVAKWIQVTDNGTTAANKALTDLGINQTWVNTIASQSDKAITTFYGTTTPTGMAEGDLWLSGTAGVPMKRYSGSAWITFEDPHVSAAYQKAADAESLADQKVKTFAQTTAPTGLLATDAGDLWINTTAGSGKVSRWSGTAWVEVVDNGASLVPLINAKGKVIIQSAAPDVADRLAQNLWIDTTSIGTPSAPGNIPKRWNGTAWVAVTEKAIVDAAKAAVDAQNSANDAIRDAGLAMSAASERSRIVHLNVTPPIPTGGWKEEDVWYKHSTVDIASPVVEWYRWKSGAWVKQIMSETFLPLVNIGTGTYGSMKGNRIEARSLLANQIVVADFENLWANPGFEDDTVGQQPAGIVDNAEALVVSGGVSGSDKALSIKGRVADSNDVYDTNIIAVKPGDQFFLSAFGRFLNTAGAAGSAGGLGFRQYGPTKAHLNWTTRLLDWATKNTAWEADPRTASYTVPAGVYYIQPWAVFTTNTETTNAFVIDDIEIRRKSAGKLIVDGAIDGKTISGALIQSSNVAYSGIKFSANQLIAYDNTLTAAGETFRIDGNTGAVTLKASITAGSSITGATVTGGVVQTSGSANTGVKLSSTGLLAYGAGGTETLRFDATNSIITGAVIRSSISGARVQMDSTGLYAYNSEGTEVTRINGTDNLLTGRMSTNTPGTPGVILVPTTSTGQPGIWFSEDGSASGTQPAIFAGVGWALTIRGKSGPNGAGPVRIEGGLNIVSGGVGGGATVNNWMIDSGGSASFPDVFAGTKLTSPKLTQLGRLSSSDRFVQAQENFAGFYFRTPSTTDTAQGDDAAIYANTTTGGLELRGLANAGARFPVRIIGGLEVWDPPTSTFGANVGIASNPKDRIYKLTSARKYKYAIESYPATKADSLLTIEPRTWFDSTQTDGYAEWVTKGGTEEELMRIGPLRRIPGLVAEEVEAAGLEMYCTYDVDGNIEGISYDRLWTLLIPLVSQLKKRVVTLEDIVSKMPGRP